MNISQRWFYGNQHLNKGQSGKVTEIKPKHFTSLKDLDDPGNQQEG